MAAKGLRAVLLGGTLAAAAIAATGMAGAQEAPIGQVNFSDPEQTFTQHDRVPATVREDTPDRFQTLAQQPGDDETAEPPRALQLELASDQGPVDVSIAQRASFGADRNGDVDQHARGSEVRIGRNLVREGDASARQGSSVYAFVASDDQALTYRPGQRSEFGGSSGGFALQDQVQVGDMSAGVTYERAGVQASLAYVEREVSTQVGRQSFGQEENFAGVTVTMRH